MRIPYGDASISFATDAPCRVAEPEISGLASGPGLADALASPVDGPAFRDFARNSKKLVFLLCDGTRPTPTGQVLDIMYDVISAHEDVSFIIATGSHRAPTGDEFRRILGSHHDEFRALTSVHDARDDALVYLGDTPRGTPVRINRAVLEADGIVVINSVEPHYFAGFTGGRKSFVPGVAGYDTIERNHSHALEPGAEPMKLRGNPVSEDMFDALALLGNRRIFSVQAVMTPGHEVHGAFAGRLQGSFDRAVGLARELYSVDVGSRADIVVTVAPPPMDSSLYQAQKALEHGRLALRPGGIIILVARCWEGIGARGFYDLLAALRSGDTTPEEHAGQNYRLGDHKALRLWSLEQDAAVWAVSDIPPGELVRVGILAADSLQDAVDSAVASIRARDREPDILVLPGGSMTVPVPGRECDASA